MRSREALEEPPVELLVMASGETPGKLTPQREKVLAEAGKPQTSAELARAAGVSSGVVKALLDAGALKHVERSLDPPFDQPDPGRPSRSSAANSSKHRRSFGSMCAPANSRRPCSTASPARARRKSTLRPSPKRCATIPRLQVLVLLPEIALTQAVTSRFQERFGVVPAEWHSAAGSKARRRVWREVAAGRARIVVGARSALFLPYRKLRLIIVDEEHDQSYKQGRRRHLPRA